MVLPRSYLTGVGSARLHYSYSFYHSFKLHCVDGDARRRRVPFPGRRVQRAETGPRGDVGHDGEDDKRLQQEAEVQNLIRSKRILNLILLLLVYKPSFYPAFFWKLQRFIFIFSQLDKYT